MSIIRPINGKYDGSLVLLDGRIITPEGEVKNILFYNNESIFDSPIIYIHPVMDPNFSVENGIVRGFSVNTPGKRCVWKLTGRVHPHYPKYREAAWVD